MKKLMGLLLFFASSASAQQLALLDTELNKTIIYADSFSPQDVFKKRFPVYCQDYALIRDQTIIMARSIQNHFMSAEFIDTLLAGHSLLTEHIESSEGKIICTVSLRTQLNNMNVVLDIVDKADNKRKAQLDLLNFSDYMNHIHDHLTTSAIKGHQ